MDVGVEDGHLIVAQGTVLDLRDEPGGVALRLGFDLLPLVHRRLILGDNQVGHVQALHTVVPLAGAHGALHHIEVGVLLGKGHQFIHARINFLHGIEVVIGGDLDALHGAQHGAVGGGGSQIIPAAQVQIGAAVGLIAP